MYQLQLLTTWGDPYYIGLNGLEFYDEQGVGVALNESSILTSSNTTSHSISFTVTVPSSPLVSIVQYANSCLSHITHTHTHTHT